MDGGSEKKHGTCGKTFVQNRHGFCSAVCFDTFPEVSCLVSMFSSEARHFGRIGSVMADTTFRHGRVHKRVKLV